MVDNGVEDAEFLYPYYRLQEAGYKIDIVAAQTKLGYTGKYGIPIPGLFTGLPVGKGGASQALQHLRCWPDVEKPALVWVVVD